MPQPQRNRPSNEKVVAGMSPLLGDCVARLRVFFAGSGVGFFVGLTQTRRADVGVNLGRYQTLVPQQFLNTANVSTAVQQMRGKAVTQRVRRGSQVQSSQLQILFQHSGNTARRKPFPKLIEENG